METDRLILRPLSLDYTEVIYKEFTEEVNVFMQPEVPESLSDSVDFITQSMKEHEDKITSIYVATTKADEEFIGLVGLHHLQDEVPEIGIWTKKGSHGHYYGREAVGGAIAIAKQLGYKKLVYPVDWRNTASKKIPLSFQGVLIEKDKQLITEKGRVLELEVYEITI